MDFMQMRRFTEMGKRIDELERRMKALEDEAHAEPVKGRTREELVAAYVERYGKEPHRNTPTMTIERALAS